MNEEFKHPSKNNPGLYVFVEAPIELIDSPVPEEARNSTKEDGTQYTLCEYLTVPPVISNDGTKFIGLLNEALSPRELPVSEADISFWDQFLTPIGLGYDSGGWMTINQWKNKLASADYCSEEHTE